MELKDGIVRDLKVIRIIVTTIGVNIGFISIKRSVKCEIKFKTE